MLCVLLLSLIHISCLAEKGKKVLAIDIDPQGNTTSGLGVDKNNVENTLYELLLGEAEAKDTIVKDVVENVDLIPSNVNLSGAEIELIGVDEKEYIMKKIIDKVRRKYDYIITVSYTHLDVYKRQVIVTFQNRLKDTFRNAMCINCQRRSHFIVIDTRDFLVF